MIQTTVTAVAGWLVVTPAMADKSSFTGNQLYLVLPPTPDPTALRLLPG